MATGKIHYIWKLAGFVAACLLAFCALGGSAVQAADRDGQAWHKGAGVAQWLDAAEVLDEDGDEAEQPAAGNGAAGGGASDSDGAPQTGSGDDVDQADSSADRAAEDIDRTGQLVMADVNKVLNVREAPGEESDKVGYLYADCGGTVLEQKDGWTKISSGELEGWASDEYLLFGEEAEELAEDVGTTIARTTTGALRIRKAPSLDAGVYDLLEEGSEYEVVDADQLAYSDGIELTEDWIAVDYEGVTGFVSAEYVETEFVVASGETLEQIKEREAAEAAAAAEAAREAKKKEIERVKAMQTDELTLLAALIQCEAGNQPYEGQVAVGAVVVNRVKSGAYPGTIKDVIFAAGQFTPAGSGRLGKLISGGKIKQSCINAAAEAIAGVSPVGSATHFRRAGSRDGIVIGNHVFW